MGYPFGFYTGLSFGVEPIWDVESALCMELCPAVCRHSVCYLTGWEELINLVNIFLCYFLDRDIMKIILNNIADLGKRRGEIGGDVRFSLFGREIQYSQI
ncbi:hypothetical protein GCM10010916_30390 [Paenibacillus abyssi]|uniref:Uncharacterized protein n=2 Tax=Paenibacillus abyssi TaxID=1340531 RepID=A0A917D5J8_9BACL|nr:hypothetical protein GCM10010916_30390 [Paenibacillus abyssi]